MRYAIDRHNNILREDASGQVEVGKTLKDFIIERDGFRAYKHKWDGQHKTQSIKYYTTAKEGEKVTSIYLAGSFDSKGILVAESKTELKDGDYYKYKISDGKVVVNNNIAAEKLADVKLLKMEELKQAAIDAAVEADTKYQAAKTNVDNATDISSVDAINYDN